nr:hypothetical protein [Tanacetum cinerariifolium]
MGFSLMAKERHASLVIGKEVDKEVEEGFNAQIKFKLKVVETIPPALQSLLDLKQGLKASRQESMLKKMLKGLEERSRLKPKTHTSWTSDDHINNDDYDDRADQTGRYDNLCGTYPKGNPEVHDDVPAYQLISSPPATTPHNPTTNLNKKHAKQLIGKARQRKNDSTKAILQKQAKHEQR